MRPRVLCAIILTLGAQAQGATLSIVGSDSMANLLTAWAEDFQRIEPQSNFEIQGVGSASAPPALAEGTADIGAMSRPMSDQERVDFRRRTGHAPHGFIVAEDALSIIVHPDNPTGALPLEVLDSLFSATRRCGGPAINGSWQNVLGAEGAPFGVTHCPEPVVRFGRTATSGSYGFFRRVALCDGDVRSDVVHLPGFAAIVNAVASTPGGVAYVGERFINETVKEAGVAIGSQPLYAGDPGYPLSRSLYLYINSTSDQPASGSLCRFLHYTQSSAGLRILAEAGFRGTPDAAAKALGDVCGNP